MGTTGVFPFDAKADVDASGQGGRVRRSPSEVPGRTLIAGERLVGAGFATGTILAA
jgi:hypothetical protein